MININRDVLAAGRVHSEQRDILQSLHHKGSTQRYRDIPTDVRNVTNLKSSSENSEQYLTVHTVNRNHNTIHRNNNSYCSSDC
jgi:hypothetical protein